MEHHYQNEDCTIYCGDCLELMPKIAAESFDSIVTDPPYGLKFMGNNWDHGVPGVPYWQEALRVAKPGAHLLAFGGSRTYHRLAVAVEDAGWEIRDCIMWVYGSGFPKSLDVSKAIDKAAGAERELIPIGNPVKRMIPGADQDKSGSWIKDNGREFQPGESAPVTDAARQWEGFGTALKPAYEPILVARKPTIGTVAANVLKHGTGGINIDGCRIGTDDTRQLKRGGKNDFPNEDDSWEPKSIVAGSACGRWPANVIHDGSDEVLRLFPNQTSGGTPAKRSSDKFRNSFGAFKGGESESGIGSSKGSAARFFYCAKATRQERRNSKHPCIKPLALMQYLVRLVTPPGSIILDPFMGSGSTIEAAWAEGMRAIGMDLCAEYCEDAANRARAGIELFGKRK